MIVVTCATTGDQGTTAIVSPERRASLSALAPGAGGASGSGSGAGASGSGSGAPSEQALRHEERVLAERRREVMTNTFYKALGKHVAPFCEPVLLPFVPSPYGSTVGVRARPLRVVLSSFHSQAAKLTPPAARIAPRRLGATQSSSLLFRAATAAGDELEQFHALFRRRCELLDDVMLERPYDEADQWEARVAERLQLEQPLLALAHDGAAPVYDGAFEALLEADIATMKARIRIRIRCEDCCADCCFCASPVFTASGKGLSPVNREPTDRALRPAPHHPPLQQVRHTLRDHADDTACAPMRPASSVELREIIPAGSTLPERVFSELVDVGEARWTQDKPS